MNFLELAQNRRSVRSYTGQKVEGEKLDRILQAANAAPTAANLQPVRLIAVQSNKGLGKIGKAADIYGAPLAIIVCADTERAWKRPYDGKSTSDIDAAIVTCHMMMEAAQQGLGSVWICYFRPDILRAEFDIPENLEPVNILAVGYPVNKTEKTLPGRIPLNELVRYEHL
ncbi:MAG: nitroreductase family protein [Oscillospiraceae bacterium]|nr:nitroreductase family protein [Oscillospiraceae bacterium]